MRLLSWYKWVATGRSMALVWSGTDPLYLLCGDPTNPSYEERLSFLMAASGPPSAGAVWGVGHASPLHPCTLHVQMCESSGEMLGGEGAGSLKKTGNL